MKKISFLIFNFGPKRLRNLWHTMNVVKDIQDKNNYKEIEYILVEHGEEKFSKDYAEKCGFKYKYHFDPLLTSHRSTLRNTAVKEANGEYVVVHDNDIIPNAEFFDEILKVINDKPEIVYFSNFKHVINLDSKLTNILIEDQLHDKVFEYGYINGTDPDVTNNFNNCQTRPHGFFTFTEATGGSFTILKETYLKAPFDEEYQAWGAEDNAFKLFMIKEIGWEKFGMLDNVLLHSYHTTGTGVYTPSQGIIKIHNDSLNTNRNKLFHSIKEESDKFKTEEYSKVLNEDNKIFISSKI
jgi:hypothetical protein